MSRQALFNQDISNITSIDPDGGEPALAAGAIKAEALDGPLVAVQKLKHASTGLAGKLLFGLSAADRCLWLGRIEVLEADVLTVEPQGVAINQARLVRRIGAIAAHL